MQTYSVIHQRLLHPQKQTQTHTDTQIITQAYPETLHRHTQTLTQFYNAPTQTL